jgi:hemolysin III
VTYDHAHDELVPSFRGLLHAYAAVLAVGASTVLVAIAPDTGARVSAAIYGAGLCALFAVSALYHRWRWDRRWRPLLRRLDHSTIFVFIAASSTPAGWLYLSGALRAAVLACVWGGAVAGIAMSVAWITAPRVLVAASYLIVGWAAVAGFPQLMDRLPVAPLILLAAGGLIYTLGAAVYAMRFPDPWPRTFGFHEVFHALVVAAAVVHFVAIAGWIVPGAA